MKIRINNFSKTIDIVPLLNSGNQIENLENFSIPDELIDFFDYRLGIDKSIKIKNLNLGNSSFAYIENENVDNVTISDNNPKCKNVNGTILNKDNEKIIFSKQFKEFPNINQAVVKYCDQNGNVTIPKSLQTKIKKFLIDCDIKTLNLENSTFDFLIFPGHSVDEITVADNNPKYENVNGDIIDKETKKIVFKNKSKNGSC